MTWSDWLPWRRRKHPLGPPARPFRVHGGPATPGTAGTDGRNQGKPDAEQPTGVYPWPFPMTCTSRQGGGTGWLCAPPTHICSRPLGHPGWHACPCSVTRTWPSPDMVPAAGFLRSVDVVVGPETGGGHRADHDEPPADDAPFGVLASMPVREPCTHPYGFPYSVPLNSNSTPQCPVCGSGPRPTEGGAG